MLSVIKAKENSNRLFHSTLCALVYCIQLCKWVLINVCTINTMIYANKILYLNMFKRPANNMLIVVVKD